MFFPEIEMCEIFTLVTIECVGNLEQQLFSSSNIHHFKKWTTQTYNAWTVVDLIVQAPYTEHFLLPSLLPFHLNYVVSKSKTGNLL